MFDDSDNARRHEPRRSYRRAGTGHLGNLDGATHVGHLDTPARTPGRNLESLCDRASRVDEHLDAVTFHDR